METIEEVEKENPLTKNISESQKNKNHQENKNESVHGGNGGFQKQKNLKC